MVIALILPVPWAARLALAATAAIGFYVALRQQALRVSPRAVVAIDIDGEGEFGLRFADAREWRGCELADSWVHPKLVLLSLRGEGRRHARVAIAADALPAEAFRRLRVWLRLRTVVG